MAHLHRSGAVSCPFAARGMLSRLRRRFAPQFPPRHDVARELRRKSFCPCRVSHQREGSNSESRAPLTCTRDARRKNSLKNESRAAGMVVRGHDQDAFPGRGCDETRDIASASSRVFSARCENFTIDVAGIPNDSRSCSIRSAMLAFRAQHAAAGHDHGRHAGAVQLGRMKRAVARIIVVPQDDDARRMERPVRSPSKARRRNASAGAGQHKEMREIEESKQEKQQAKENSAVFAAPHEIGSMLRRRSAASSGIKAL